MRYVPQSNFTNAAFTPEAKVYVGMPGLSSIYFGATNNGFRWNDLVSLQTVSDSFKLNLDVPKALGAMKEKNIFAQEFRMGYFNFGFKLGNNHLAFNMSARQKFSFTYTRDMVALLLVGNGLTPAESNAIYGTEDYGFLGETADLTGTGINFTQFTEIGVKYSRSFLDEKLRIGVRPKLLIGLINLQTKRGDLTLNTDAETFALTTTGGMEINSSVPGGFLPDTGSIQIGSLLGIGNNMGFGMDIGATYLLSEKLELSAAINDLGFISWKNNPKNYITNDFDITFAGLKGFEDEFLDETNIASDSAESQLSQLVDTLLATFTPDTTTNNYTTGIGARFNLGARYAFTKRQSVAVLLAGQMVAKQFKPAVSIAYNIRLYKWLGATAAYNAYNRSFTNLGVGLSFNIFPVQFHFITDNIFALSPSSTKYVHARFGMNLTFGYNKKDNKEKRTF